MVLFHDSSIDDCISNLFLERRIWYPCITSVLSSSWGLYRYYIFLLCFSIGYIYNYKY